MKYFFALSFLFIAGCSTSTTPTASPYSSGGEFYVAPGTFTGTWLIFIDSNVFRIDTDSCKAVITEADSLLLGTITNDSNKEVLSLSGVHLWPTDDAAPHDYEVQTISSLGDTDAGLVKFSLVADSFWYSPYQSSTPATPPIINCFRK